MELTYNELPVVGQRFRVEVRDFSGIPQILIFIGGRLFSEINCPAEPCYEDIVIPAGTAGVTLRVIAADSGGAREELEFIIKRQAEG